MNKFSCSVVKGYFCCGSEINLKFFFSLGWAAYTFVVSDDLFEADDLWLKGGRSIVLILLDFSWSPDVRHREHLLRVSTPSHKLRSTC